MTDYEQWLAMCEEQTEIDAQVRAALATVTAHMKPGSRGNPSEAELDDLDVARKRRDDLSDRMDAWIQARFR